MKTEVGIVTEPHFFSYRVGARFLETKEYIQKVSPDETLSGITERAIREGWFGSKSKDYARRLVSALYSRISEYRTGFALLKNSVDELEPLDLRMILHFQLHLSDPYYRWITGVFFPERRRDGFLFVSVDELSIAFAERVETDVNSVTLRSYSSKILTLARDLGILKGKSKKEFDSPIVSEKALLYILAVWQSLSLPLTDFLNFEFTNSVLDRQTLLRILDKGYSRKFWEYQLSEEYFSCTLFSEKVNELFRVGV